MGLTAALSPVSSAAVVPSATASGRQARRGVGRVSCAAVAPFGGLRPLPVVAGHKLKRHALLRVSTSGKDWTPRVKCGCRGGHLDGAVRCSCAQQPWRGLLLEDLHPQLPYKKDGYNFWTWRNHKVHYVVQGQGPPMVLIHGFGASAVHWRYNIPELAKTHTVYAMDLLGFGLSEKALIDYNADVWRDQVADFVREVVGKPAVLAVQKHTILFAFWQAKQPARIESVLRNVYKDQTNVDDYLVQSIVQSGTRNLQTDFALRLQIVHELQEV